MCVSLEAKKGIKMSKFGFKESLLASTMIAGMIGAAPARAQDAPPTDAGPAAGVQSQDPAGAAEEVSTADIVVTGTLIKNPNLVSSSPVSVVGQEELQLQQTNNAEEVLRDLPGAVPSIGSAVNNGNNGAARHYFDKDPADLSLAEAAMLAGMIKAPSALAPTDDLEGARARAEVVLGAMVDAGMITQAEADDAGVATVRNGRPDLPVGGYFADWVSQQAKATVEPAFGMQDVRTTLDARLQRHAEDVVRWALDFRGARKGAGQAAVVVMTAEGEVLALVGGRSYADSQFNRATQARRQPGSVFKLFVYLAALRDGMTLDDTVADTPLDGDRAWRPGNYGDDYTGREISLREAFARSSNVAAVRLAERVGPGAVVRAARDLGIDSELVDEPSIALGTSGG